MGIVSSTFASLAIQLAWNCQRLLDPQYRYLEGKRCLKTLPNTLEIENSDVLDVACVGKRNCEKRSSSSSSSSGNLKLCCSNGELMRGKRSSSTMQGRQRYRKKRPASFDTALIANRSDNPPSLHLTCIVTSTPSQNQSPLGRPQPMFWDVTSSSGCSSDSGSYLDSDSEIDERLNEAFLIQNCEEDITEDEKKEKFAMSAEDETALRMTVGRGHFSRSKKDRFLNHLRLEKKLNGLNNSFNDTNQLGHGHNSMGRRRYSGDLYRVTY